MYKTESTRFFTARTHFCLKLDHPRLDRSIYGSAVVTRRLRSKFPAQGHFEGNGDITPIGEQLAKINIDYACLSRNERC